MYICAVITLKLLKIPFMRLFEKIRGSFSAQLSLWVAAFVVVISAVVMLLVAGFSKEVIRDELTDTTVQTLENTALKIHHSIRQAEIVAQLEHKPFQLDKAYVEELLKEHKPQQLSQIEVTEQPDGARQRSVTELLHEGEPSYRFYEPLYDGQYGLVVFIPTKVIYKHYLDVQRILKRIGVVGLLLLLTICTIVIVHRLQPLRQLAIAAQHIAGGQLNEPIPDTSSKDEIGKLQNSIAKMQRSLNTYLEVMKRKQAMLSSQNAKLQEAYSEIQEYDALKNKFVSEMTSKMSTPVKNVCQHTETICANYETLTKADMARIQIDILSATEEVTLLMDQLLNSSDQPEIYDATSDNPVTLTT